jgi:hypothetical protein
MKNTTHFFTYYNLVTPYNTISTHKMSELESDGGETRELES